MRFISVRDLNTKPKEIWGKISNEEVVITSNGRPIALLSAVNEETLEKTIRTLRRSRALMALEDLQNQSLASGIDKLEDAEIEAEIQAVRRGRRR
ncbi:MAG: prevent-host-death family protein [Deltaproteobacteria bacterium]|jgi:antitoxin (DNA-binding transcriptional repressor) of toxin-antitoxin stability system|nr:prevent-host-death family protein [Deltaproteobacteria bacterium]